MRETPVRELQEDQAGKVHDRRLSRRAALGAGAAAVAVMAVAAPAPVLASALAVDTPATHRVNAAIWANWLALWNGDLSQAAKIIAPDIKLHLTPIGGAPLASLESPAGMARWIGGLHAAFAPLTFTVQVAPLFQGAMIAGRWRATGRYAGGFPGAKARPGTPLAFAGADFLRIKDGKIAEYWLSADVLDLMSQLQIK